jgi:organic hydroperoxide reductase OsmC/OhrA
MLNGEPVPLGDVAALEGRIIDDPVARCAANAPTQGPDDLLMQDGWSRKSEGKAPLHVAAAGTMDANGFLRLQQELRAPCGSAWSVGAGGADAPDALAHVSAGIGFCFMTQLEILADMHGIDVKECRLVQDTTFGPGGAQSGNGKAPGFAPIETHLFVTSDSATPAEIAELVDMAESACYLHALCRTELKPIIRVAKHQGALANGGTA